MIRAHFGLQKNPFAAESLTRAGGGGTYILRMPADWRPEKTARMRQDGWQVFHVNDWKETLAFAREFVRLHYNQERCNFPL